VRRQHILPSANRLGQFLGLVSLAFAAAYVVLGRMGGPESTYTIVRGSFAMLDLNAEATLPAWFSTGLWLLAAALAAEIAYWRRRVGLPFAKHWRGIFALFLFLSADEAAQVHENIGRLLWKYVVTEASGIHYYVWTMWGIGFVAVAAAIFLRPVLALPPRIRFGIFASAVVFLAGALGFEMTGAAVDSGTLRIPMLEGTGWLWTVLIVAEETCEMLGASMLCYFLLRHLQEDLDATAYRQRKAVERADSASSASSALSLPSVQG